MPNPFLVNLRGTPAYGKALDRLAKAAGVDGRNQLAVVAIEALAAQHGVVLPERAQKHGTNRFTAAPKKKSKKLPD